RLRLFADAYGLIPRDRRRFVSTIRRRIVDHIEGIRRMAAAGDPAFVRIVDNGHLRRPMRDLQLLDRESHLPEAALRRPRHARARHGPTGTPRAAGTPRRRGTPPGAGHVTGRGHVTGSKHDDTSVKPGGHRRGNTPWAC